MPNPIDYIVDCTFPKRNLFNILIEFVSFGDFARNVVSKASLRVVLFEFMPSVYYLGEGRVEFSIILFNIIEIISHGNSHLIDNEVFSNLS